VSYLLDTHTFLWWIGDDSQLSRLVHQILADEKNEVYFSVVSAWEIAIKAHTAKFGFNVDPSFIPRDVADNGFITLPVQMRHALRVYGLPRHHGDPFDRLLVAQALLEGLTLLSNDTTLRRYPVDVVW